MRAARSRDRDVTARCVSMLARSADRARQQVLARNCPFAPDPAMAEGSCMAAGMNYIYVTLSVLCALNAVQIDHQDPRFARPCSGWSQKKNKIQNEDGGWGEMPTIYRLDDKGFEGASLDRLANGMGLA